MNLSLKIKLLVTIGLIIALGVFIESRRRFNQKNN